MQTGKANIPLQRALQQESIYATYSTLHCRSQSQHTAPNSTKRFPFCLTHKLTGLSGCCATCTALTIGVRWIRTQLSSSQAQEHSHLPALARLRAPPHLPAAPNPPGSQHNGSTASLSSLGRTAVTVAGAPAVSGDAHRSSSALRSTAGRPRKVGACAAQHAVGRCSQHSASRRTNHAPYHQSKQTSRRCTS
jgi:hypothetical protein